MPALNTAKPQRPRPVPANLAPFAFKPGQSGNPGGRGGAYYEARQICRNAAPEAARVMVELLQSDDDRVRLMAAREIYDRAFGRPKEYDPKEDDPLAGLAPAERRARVAELLAFAATLQVPETREEGDGDDGTAIDGKTAD